MTIPEFGFILTRASNNVKIHRVISKIIRKMNLSAKNPYNK